MSQNPSAGVVQAAAKLAFASSAAKQRAANQIILACKTKKHTLDTVQLALETVAQAAWLQPKDLLKQLKADPCFRVVQGAGAGSPSGYFVGLNIPKIISKAKNTTSTGILTEELPPPKGFVDGKHPIRPGAFARNCCMIQLLLSLPASYTQHIRDSLACGLYVCSCERVAILGYVCASPRSSCRQHRVPSHSPGGASLGSWLMPRLSYM
jgi:hypothetical protein